MGSVPPKYTQTHLDVRVESLDSALLKVCGRAEGERVRAGLDDRTGREEVGAPSIRVGLAGMLADGHRTRRDRALGHHCWPKIQPSSSDGDHWHHPSLTHPLARGAAEASPSAYRSSTKTPLAGLPIDESRTVSLVRDRHTVSDYKHASRTVAGDRRFRHAFGREREGERERER